MSEILIPPELYPDDEYRLGSRGINMGPMRPHGVDRVLATEPPPKPAQRTHEAEYINFHRCLFWCHIINEPGLAYWPNGADDWCCQTCEQEIHWSMHTFIAHVRNPRVREQSTGDAPPATSTGTTTVDGREG